MSRPDSGLNLSDAQIARCETETTAMGRLSRLLDDLAAEPLPPLRDDQPAPVWPLAHRP